MCVEQELAIGNSFFFKKKGINKYTWISDKWKSERKSINGLC